MQLKGGSTTVYYDALRGASRGAVGAPCLPPTPFENPVLAMPASDSLPQSLPPLKIDAQADLAGREPLAGWSIFAALLCCALWGGNSVAVKIAAHEMPPVWMAALRFGMATAGMALWARWRGVPLAIDRAVAAALALSGLLLFAQIASFNVGTVWSTSIHSVVLVNVFPLTTALIAHYWLPHFPLSRRKLLGLVLAFGGVAVMFGDQLVLPGRDQLWGDLILLASATVLGFKLTLVKTLMDRVSPLQVVFWDGVLATPLFLLTSLAVEGPQGLGYSAAATAAVVYQGCAVSGVAFLLFAVLLARHSPNDLSSYSFTTPLFGMVFGAAMLGEVLTPLLAAGGLLIAVGIYLVNTQPRRGA